MPHLTIYYVPKLEKPKARPKNDWKPEADYPVRLLRYFVNKMPSKAPQRIENTLFAAFLIPGQTGTTATGRI